MTQGVDIVYIPVPLFLYCHVLYGDVGLTHDCIKNT